MFAQGAGGAAVPQARNDAGAALGAQSRADLAARADPRPVAAQGLTRRAYRGIGAPWVMRRKEQPAVSVGNGASATVIVAGGGPAGMMAGYLLARAGIG